jgi:hypothetical protein
MNAGMQLQTILAGASTARQQPALFALLILGILESLDQGLLSAADAVGQFFHAENCLYVRKQLRNRLADEIMSRGVQLPDLFDALAAADAHRDFQRELAAMRALCFKLLEDKRSVA